MMSWNDPAEREKSGKRITSGVEQKMIKIFDIEYSNWYYNGPDVQGVLDSVADEMGYINCGVVRVGNGDLQLP